MLRMQVVIFPGLTGPYTRNDSKTFSEIPYGPSSRSTYRISVRKQILKALLKKKIMLIYSWFNLWHKATYNLRIDSEGGGGW